MNGELGRMSESMNEFLDFYFVIAEFENWR